MRGMGEYWLPTVPFVNELMVRTGSVVGTRKNCVDMLEQGECVIAFPEGVRGMNKLIWERYQLQEFGHGFMRLALETDTPIVPIAVVGSEEQAPAIANLQPLGAPARHAGLPDHAHLAVARAARHAAAAGEVPHLLRRADALRRATRTTRTTSSPRRSIR